MVVMSGARGATGIYWVEARDTAEHPRMHRTAPTTKNDPAPHAAVPQLRN